MISQKDEQWKRARRDMVDRVMRHFEETSHVTGTSLLEDPVKDALLHVPRHSFVPSASIDLAYADSALPIGFGQTISQPYIVALMIQLARVDRGARVLEVGTGCGYEAAVLSEIAGEVYTIERLPELVERSRVCLSEAGYEGIHLRSGDGFLGWPEAAPYDAIIVTACGSEIPPPLLEQLAIGGRMVIPIGRQNAYQELQVIEKTREGGYEVRCGLPVAFVPLVHSE
jgi:protein-L-isoaspartate(D-aspartate) O-methyltransferase